MWCIRNLSHLFLTVLFWNKSRKKKRGTGWPSFTWKKTAVKTELKEELVK